MKLVKNLLIGTSFVAISTYMMSCSNSNTIGATDNLSSQTSTQETSPINANHTISAAFTAQSTSKYEAEKASFWGGANKNTNHAGYSGTGFVDGFYNNTTAVVSFVVNVDSAGSYYVNLHYSAGNGASSNTGLYVNGSRLTNIYCFETSNWDTWADKTEIVMLNSGNNTITYRADTSSSGCINLDYITLTYNGSIRHSISVSAGPDGTISPSSPSGSLEVNNGVSQTFTITANDGYQVDDVNVDGTSQGSITSYTFANVGSNHSISATFKPSSDPNPCYGFQGGGNGLKGTAFGLTAWSAGSEYCKATDGDINTFYDAAIADAAYTGLDLGPAGTVIGKIKFYPRAGWAPRMVGGKFQCSIYGNNYGWTDLYTITTTPTMGWNEVTVSNPYPYNMPYRWVRYVSPNGGYGNIAEMEFY